MLEDDLDCSDELAEVGVVYDWEYSKEETRPFAIDIVQQLPGLIAARYLFLRVGRDLAKRSREVFSGLSDRLAVAHPDVLPKNSPRPYSRPVKITSARLCTPEVEEEGCQVNQWLVHYISTKTSRER